MKTQISIIMPTLNEESRIVRTLIAIRNQTIEQDSVEVLVIDGGSIDKTREIAEKYNARVIDNIKKLPEEAKKIGLSAATGKYIIVMGADEVLNDRNTLKRRLELFRSNKEVKVIYCNGLLTPDDYPRLTRYANNCGDPFSYFVYRLDAEDLISSLNKRKYSIKITNTGGRIYYPENKLIPIGDGGTLMMDYEFLRENFGNKLDDPDFASTVCDDVVKLSGCFGILDNDTILHYTTVSYKTFLSKLKFRVINNLEAKSNISGYSARTETNKKLNNRKFLFILYCLLPPLVLIDSLILAIRKRCLAFALHFVFTYYVIFQIIWCSLKKLFGVKLSVSTYGK